MNILYLTNDEQKLFQKLSEALKEGWKVEEEKMNSYESDAVLEMRQQMVHPEHRKLPALAALSKQLEKGNLEKVTFPKLPDDVYKEFFFTIGARGIHPLIDGLLHSAKTDDDMIALGDLTTMRHQLLLINSQTPVL